MTASGIVKWMVKSWVEIQLVNGHLAMQWMLDACIQKIMIIGVCPVGSNVFLVPLFMSNI